MREETGDSTKETGDVRVDKGDGRQEKADRRWERGDMRSGWGTTFFSVRYITFFSVLKKERFVLFSSFL